MPSRPELEMREQPTDNVFGELLEWIGQIETLTDTIRRRIDKETTTESHNV